MPSRRRVLRLGALAAAGGAGYLSYAKAQSQTFYRPEQTGTLNCTWRPFEASPWSEQWRRVLDTDPAALSLTGGGRVAVVGTHTDGDGDRGWVVILDDGGAVRTRRTLTPAEQSGRLFTATPTRDGVLVGGVANESAWLVSLTESGTRRWSRLLDPPRGRASSFSLRPMPVGDGDQASLLAGKREAATDWRDSAWLAALTSAGAVRWNRVYDAAVSSIDGALVAGASRFHLVGLLDGRESVGSRAGVLSIRNGATDWRRTYPAYWFWDLTPARDGSSDMLVVGETNPESGESAGVVARLDEAGRSRWWRTLGDRDGAVSLAAVTTTRTGYLLTGSVSREEGADRPFLLSVGSSGSRCHGYWLGASPAGVVPLSEDRLAMASTDEETATLRLLERGERE